MNIQHCDAFIDMQQAGGGSLEVSLCVYDLLGFYIYSIC